jgi:asparagine synthase (glutamine-hydrolysing)
MCGICGIAGYDPVAREDLVRMTRVLRHRGPDDEGFFLESYADGLGVGLGFRRLSIIDLETGNQPITNETATVQLVFNGEIYNFRELRQELEARGHRFATNADTEVIVHLYEEVGVHCVERLNGMFAFALWDSERHELVLARDRFGKKPLYYAELGRSLVFGSELKSLLEHPKCQRRLDFESLTRYLALEYVPTPGSIIEGVRKLPGGHVLRWSGGRPSVEPYWDLSFGDEVSPLTDDEYAEMLREHLRAAVRRRLMSDVPLGAFLSGGIDSSSVVALMVEAMPSKAVKTFTIGFGESSFDESDHARRVAQHFGTDHHEDVFTPEVMLGLLPTMADFVDEPFADASILPTYLLSRFTREHVTVALGGDGSDELLAGYPTFTADRLAKLYPLPRVLHEGMVVPLVDRLPVSTSNFSFDFKLKRFVRAAALPPDTRHATWLGSFDESELVALLTGDPGDALDDQRRIYSAAPSANGLERLIYLYAKTYLQDDILVKVDRASMACSLEVRAPFLDVDLVEFLGSVPPRLKLRRLETKHVLKRAMSDLLPPGIATRKKKGFGIPIAQWFKDELRDELQEELGVARLKAQGIFEPAEVQRLLKEHLSGRRDHRKSLWTLFVFQLWHRRWMEGGHRQSADEPPPITTPSPIAPSRP